MRFTSLHYARTFPLLEFLAEFFQYHVHHFQCLMVPVLILQYISKIGKIISTKKCHRKERISPQMDYEEAFKVTAAQTTLKNVC